MIIDAHLHFNEIDGSYDKAYKKLNSSMSKNDIGKCIIIPDNVEGSGCADLATALKYTSEDIFVVGSPNILNQKKGEFDQLKNLFEERKIIGLKLFPGHDAYYANDERCNKYFELCEDLSVPLIFHTGINTGDEDCAKYNDPKYIVDVAKRHPELKIVIAHYFWPKMEYCYKITKGINNLYFDTSAMADPEVVDLTGGIEKVREVLEKTMQDRPDSVIFGSDYDMCDVRLHIDLIRSLSLSEDEKENIFSKNALKLFTIKNK